MAFLRVKVMTNSPSMYNNPSDSCKSRTKLWKYGEFELIVLTLFSCFHEVLSRLGSTVGHPWLRERLI